MTVSQVTAVELKTLLGKYASTDELAMNGVTVGGVKYMFLSANDRVVRAKKGTSGVHCIKTVQGRAGAGAGPRMGRVGSGRWRKPVRSPHRGDSVG